MYSLNLFKPNLADTGWQLSSIAYKNTIESPVRYGVTQPGAYGSPAERFHGGPYRLIIVRLDGSPTGVVADTTLQRPLTEQGHLSRLMSAGGL